MKHNKSEAANNSRLLTVAEIFDSGVATGKMAMCATFGTHIAILKTKIRRDNLTPRDVLEDLERWIEVKIGGINDPL
ncbi:hypothetical protein [Klebsiella oxytoca]|uniref:hypothetical protein n=1 Tax=Klebsiella oxytoca TaxID=571 RepID=UPI001B900A06|nr:hypothetical protein [Klebsiella oxytoca]EJM1004368.1 hypothetical protein [Klebsiella oxytoca]EKQ7240000.1 hypothetical protein [Klebsiella oxytoca]WBD79892.1 hypothetical protein OEE41_12980 [Klebsiella oxytoca]HBC8618096.1 hypothetical protein [Klebsiella oxytoca]